MITGLVELIMLVVRGRIEGRICCMRRLQMIEPPKKMMIEQYTNDNVDGTLGISVDNQGAFGRHVLPQMADEPIDVAVPPGTACVRGRTSASPQAYIRHATKLNPEIFD